MESTTITSIPDLPPFKTPSETQLADLHHISALIHLLHHRNHNQHRRSAWYRHFNLFRRHLSALSASITELQRVPDTHLARHRKKAADKQTELGIRQRLAFWRDVLVPKTHHAFGQLTADGRFAVLGVMLLACLGSVSKMLGLVGVYDELGQLEVQKVLEQFAKDNWGEDEGMGIPLSREQPARAGAEDFGEVLRRDVDEDEDENEEDARATEARLKAKESACLAPERDVLRQSREALREMSVKASASASPVPQDVPVKKTSTAFKRIEKEQGISSTTSSPTRKETATSEKAAKTKLKTKRPKEDEEPIASSKPKKKRKKNAIDELFGL